jgi:hypothetical protein
VLHHLGHQRGAALSALLAFFLGMPFAGQVLCVGEGGHVAVEFAGAGDAACAHPAPGDDHAGDELCGHDDGCGSCRDARLGAAGPGIRLTSPRDAIAASAEAPVTIGPAIHPEFERARSRARFDGSALPSPTSVEILRTTVLRV